MDSLKPQGTGENLSRVPELSLVMPCYNEEGCLELTVPPLIEAFQQAGVNLEVVLVDNGSKDRTSEVIDTLIGRGLPVTKGVVPRNQGQGLGIRTGLNLSRGQYVGYICADGQVAARDVVMIYRALRTATLPTLAKVRRRYRPDSPTRRVVSIFYNAMMHVLFFPMSCLDVNGNPKIMPGYIVRRMELESNDWFLEAEVMLKARHMGMPIIEMDVFDQLRQAGTSHVRFATILEFLRNIMVYRLGGPWRNWRRRVIKIKATDLAIDQGTSAGAIQELKRSSS